MKVKLMDFDKALELFEPVLGFEVHVELGTKTKMFSAAPNPAHPEFHGAAPNTLIDPLSLGLPGSLPVTNETAVRYSIRRPEIARAITNGWICSVPSKMS